MILRTVALVLALSSPAIAETVPEPDGYREDPYRAPVPATLAGATVIDEDQAFALWEAGRAAFIDVFPRAPKPANLPEGTIWREKPHHSIPGALWLPNVGYGRLADVTADYYRKGLEQATGGDPSHPIVLFCLAECWMSWNAAKRALEWGYTDVYWMPEGMDAWKRWNHPTEKLTPLAGHP